MISIIPDLRRPILRPPQRDPLLPPPSPSTEIDYKSRFDILGTVHFTRRSIMDTIELSSSGEYERIALELDRDRFDSLSLAGHYASPRLKPFTKGEFLSAADALGNRDIDIWLIDLSIREIIERLMSIAASNEVKDWIRIEGELMPYERLGLKLWEEGYRDRAIHYLNLSTKYMKDYSPSIYRVLIEERNHIMAARLIDIANKYGSGKTLVLTGMAHVDGIRYLIDNPSIIRAGFERYGLNYSPPERVRRVKVN